MNVNIDFNLINDDVRRYQEMIKLANFEQKHILLYKDLYEYFFVNLIKIKKERKFNLQINEIN